MSQNQKIHQMPGGEEVVFRPTVGERVGQTIIQLIWVLMASSLLFWTWPSILAYFQYGEIIGPAKLLDRFQMGPRGFLAAMIGWCVFIVWFGLGGLYEILKVHIKKDRFLLRPEALIVKNSAFLTQTFTMNIHEQFALRLRPGAPGVLEAKTKSGWRILTINGTMEDRAWLLQVLQDRYRAPRDLQVTEVSKERMGIYMVERSPDGRLKIESTVASTIGCATISGVLCLAFAGIAIWSLVKGTGAGLIFLIFAVGIALGGMSALNRRTIEASRGRLRVQWSSPVGKIASRFLSMDHFLLKYEFGEGSYTRESGTLRLQTSHYGKSNTPKQTIVLVREPTVPPTEAYGLIPEILEEEDLVLKVHGHGEEQTAHELLQLLSETTGFPIGQVTSGASPRAI